MLRMFKTIAPAIVLVSVLAFAAPAAHAGKSCAKHGYKTVEQHGGMVMKKRDIRSNRQWSEDAADYYVCSTEFRRRVPMGEFGITWDGEIFFSDFTVYANYVAYTVGSSGNAGEGSIDSVVLLNLKTGVKRRFNVVNTDSEASVGAIALDGNGAIGWTTPRALDEEGTAYTCDVHLSKRRDGKKHKVVASSPTIDCGFLRFGYLQIGGKQQLIWATSSSNVDAE